MNNLFSQDFSRTLVIGAGSLGCLAARMGAEDGEDSAAVWAAAHVDSAELIATGLEKKIFLKAAGGPFGARGIAQSLEENAAAIEKLARGRESAILFGEASDELAVNLIAALSRTLEDLNVNVSILVVEPFSPQGEVQTNELEENLNQLVEAATLVCALNPGMENVSAGVAVKAIRRMAAERLGAATECLAGALKSESQQVLLKTLRGMHRAVFTTAAHPGSYLGGLKTISGLQACDAALRSLGEDTIQRIDAVIVSSAAEISFRESRAIALRIPADAVFVPIVNSARSGRAECLLLSGTEAAENVVSINSAFERSQNFASVSE